MMPFATRPDTYFAGLRKKLEFLHGNWRLVLVWPIVGLIVGITGWAFVNADSRADRAHYEQTGLTGAQALANAYGNQVEASISAIDQMLLQLRLQWELDHGEVRLNDERAAAAFPPTSPFSIAILDASGTVTASLPKPANDATLIREEYFQAHLFGIHDFLYIGEPETGPITQNIRIPFSRRLEHADGSFAGVVVVFVDPAYFTPSYNERAFGRYGFIAVLGGGDILSVMRSGNVVYPAAGHHLLAGPRFPIFSEPRLMSGERWFADGRNRYVGWSTVGGTGLTAMVGLAQQEVLAPYLVERKTDVRDAALATLIGIAFVLTAMALSLRLAWRKQEVQQVHAAYRMATEHGREGFYILTPKRRADQSVADFEIRDCNRRGAEIFLRRREELVGSTFSQLLEGASAEQIVRILIQALESGAHEADLKGGADGSTRPRWLQFVAMRTEDNIALTVRDITDAKTHVEELERRSNEDILTGLPNRQWVTAYLPSALTQAAAGNAMLAVLFIDLDGFKTVNDTMGHRAGDEVLRHAALRIKDAVRPHDRVARLGGDEFVVILENLAQAVDASHVAERILQAFRNTFRIAEGVHSLGVSIGISMFPADGSNAEALMHHADIAMYSVKTAGKRGYRFYDEQFYAALRARLELEGELREAIARDQFVMFYQPRVDIATGAVSSLEALVRWAHPARGLVGPLEFIPLVEETGLILTLGELVMDKVCAQMARWARAGGSLLPVSVNVSSRQINEADIAALLASCLARHRIEPGLIEVEVTESSMMIEGREVADSLTAIQQMGVKLLVDDFGTGYSSLAQLQRLAFDVLKVDRAFTAELGKSKEGKVFFNAIITMAHALGMRVVAEGVESLEQVRILQALKCDEVQGYYISEPMPASDTQAVPLPHRFPSVA